ncbi:hypothetical protein PUN28_005557 [Cardiocondyla obscurior]|uniref:Uncharacterized protein n=1 Tax=Cardiocondyla obscurior TaxID=286306 RepID=A0AAW2GJR4_9HYME
MLRVRSRYHLHHFSLSRSLSFCLSVKDLVRIREASRLRIAVAKSAIAGGATYLPRIRRKGRRGEGVRKGGKRGVTGNEDDREEVAAGRGVEC